MTCPLIFSIAHCCTYTSRGKTFPGLELNPGLKLSLWALYHSATKKQSPDVEFVLLLKCVFVFMVVDTEIWNDYNSGFHGNQAFSGATKTTLSDIAVFHSELCYDYSSRFYGTLGIVSPDYLNVPIPP